jgi:hypothetical protein
VPSRLHQERKNLAVENKPERFGAKRQKKGLLPGQAEGQVTSMDTTKQQASEQAQLQAQQTVQSL